MAQFSTLPPALESALATLAHKLDCALPGRHRGRLARITGRTSLRYISPEIGNRTALLSELQARALRYAAIGGTPATSAIDGSDQLALIIDDDAVNATRRLLTPWPAGEPIEVYSPSGLPGFAFGDMPLMPPKFAGRLLANAGMVDGIRTAAPVDLFFATVFRQVYLKGLQSGIPTRESDHHHTGPLVAALRTEADRLGIELPVPVTLESLDAFLLLHDWRPPLDMLERIGCWNPWVADILRQAGEWLGSEAPGLTVFYLRQRAIDEGTTEAVLATLQQNGFRLLPVPMLTELQLQEITAEVRGGNWGRGPFPLSGGNPGLVVVGYDPRPIAPDAATLKKFPLLDNFRIQLAKQAVRDTVQAGLPRAQRYNALHSTDNAVQAWRAVGSLYPKQEQMLRAAIMDQTAPLPAIGS